MTAGTILSILSAVFAIARFLVGYAEQKKWMDAGAAAATLKGIDDADATVKSAKEARAVARDTAVRDPASVVRDDDGFKRPDD